MCTRPKLFWSTYILKIVASQEYMSSTTDSIINEYSDILSWLTTAVINKQGDKKPHLDRIKRAKCFIFRHSWLVCIDYCQVSKIHCNNGYTQYKKDGWKTLNTFRVHNHFLIHCQLTKDFSPNWYTLKNLKWTEMAIPFWVRIYMICFLSEMYFLFYFTINAVVSL